MQIEEIMDMWEIDSKINPHDISGEALKISSLHSRYYNIFVRERLLLRKLESEFKLTRLEKYEFYTQGPNEVTKAKGWRLPPKGIILKSDVPMYMDADQDLSKLQLRIDLQKEKIDILESIIKTVSNRNFALKTAVDFMRFQAGN
jgi:hypothetical protein